MIGFIKKDFAMIKGNFKTFAIILLVYTVLAVQGEANLLFLLPCLSVMMMISTFSYDSYNKWEAYLITFPNGRKNSVLAKYLSTLILLFLATILLSILSFIVAYMKESVIDFESICFPLFGTMFATVFLQAIMYPCIYKFGVEKARMGIFIGIFGLGILFGILSETFNLSFTQLTIFLDTYGLIVLPIFIVITLYISYVFSKRIFFKKEF